jgi:uncharacterized membrane protein YeaQ/YmgE (transglycosylase-associated protein family)
MPPALERASIVATVRTSGRRLRHARGSPTSAGGPMGIMSIIWMIVIGFIVGVLARYFYPGAVNLGFWMTTLLGIGGSIVGGIIGGLFSKSPDGKFHTAGLIMSVIGALILLWAYINYYPK